MFKEAARRVLRYMALGIGGVCAHLECECVVRWRALEKQPKCLVEVGAELLFGWKALATPVYIAPRAGVRVRVHKGS